MRRLARFMETAETREQLHKQIAVTHASFCRQHALGQLKAPDLRRTVKLLNRFKKV